MAEKSSTVIPFEKHPLYQEAMDQIVAGDKEAAVDTLKRLSERYPDEQFLEDLLVRVQLQSTFGDEKYIPVDRSQKANLVDQVAELFSQYDDLVIGLAPEGTRSKSYT